MPDHHRSPRSRGLALATALAIAGASALAATAFAAPAAAGSNGASVDTIDYIHDTYGITDSVIETVTFERFEYLLQQEGRFAFIIGGPEDARTAATVATIDAQAKAAGVAHVYAFDPKLDGATLDIRTTANADVAPLWTRLVTNALGKDTQTPFDGTDDPYFFVYDKSHTEGGVEDRIVSALTAPVTAEQLAVPSALTAYQADVAGVFSAAGALSSVSQFTFYKDVVDAKHGKDYAGDPNYGGATILDDSDSDWRVQGVTYPELVDLLQSDGDYVLFFGGTWCHNTRAVLKDVNAQAVASGVKKVYFFDLRLDGASANDLHIRDTASEFANFYGDLVDTYLPGLKTQYVTGGSASQRVEFYPGGDTTKPLAIAQKLQVPFVFEYDRTRIVDGKPAPVVQQWIHDNGDGTYKEYMTEWWYVIDKPGRYGTRPDPAALATQLAFADEAVSALGTFFSSVGEPTGGPTAPPSESPSPTPSPTTPPTDGPGEVDPTTVKGSVSVSGDLVPGGKITVTGSGLAADTTGFSVELHSTPQTLGTVSTNAAGAFTFTGTIPASVPAGAHSIVVTIDGVAVATAAVTVGAAAVAAADPSSTGLASTGAGFVAPLVWLALALFAAAAVVFTIARVRARGRTTA